LFAVEGEGEGEDEDEGDKIAYLLQWQNHSIGSYVCHCHFIAML